MTSVEEQRIVSFRPRYISWAWNGLAVFGLLALVYLGGNFLVDRFTRGFCDITVDHTTTNADSTAKATLFRTECGAAAADRVHVVLSNAKVDGVKDGFEVLTLVNASGPIEANWIGPRTLGVTYAAGEIEYQVLKTRGVTIQLDRKR
ncbi:MAG TPA: hypothetical protein VN577_19055 [Terriglobales bacterium]|nr:hypothetical protein [Terriglobales bacterium]